MTPGKRQRRNQNRERRKYILYDSRAWGGDTSEASVLVVCEDDAEAQTYKGEYGGMACFSYRVDGKNLVDERFEWSYAD